MSEKKLSLGESLTAEGDKSIFINFYFVIIFH